ncbi:DUF4194 domain-containing protein [Steroidobacter sp. S1-65]|uniref:DUF4194 domain-containing protein n=1 Tax=Steroidobacter gossypii TaxID=2805490 RepID=A0ABS1WXX8_9GAMM|nr:DUF4194 domain-containing protein [Steroidobacter gossypii]MBM0105834.1 DUF4194 domain-containing protein [Steroidobacter gossypii]
MTSIFDQLTARSGTAASDSGDAQTEKKSLDSASGEEAGRASGQAGGYTPRRVKDGVLELLKYGLLEEQRKPNLYRDLLAQREAIGAILEPLDLSMRVDEIRGIAFLVVADQAFERDEDEWLHPLVRRQRLNLEQSLLIAILRQQFVAHEQQAGVGSSEAVVSIDDLLPQLQLYLGELGSDAQEQKRLRNLLEHLKAHGIVSDVDEHDRIRIRPIIAHVANPENLQNLLRAFRDEAGRGRQAQAPSTEEGER